MFGTAPSRWALSHILVLIWIISLDKTKGKKCLGFLLVQYLNKQFYQTVINCKVHNELLSITGYRNAFHAIEQCQRTL